MFKEKLKNKDFIICSLVFAVYVIITFIGVLNHELWFDEAQAWVLTRENSIAGIFSALRNEGHPALWYLILFPFTHLGFPCKTVTVISWLISVIAVGVFLKNAPFGCVMKSIVVFSSGFTFCNSINSRPYCIILLLLGLIASVYPKRIEHPIIFGLLVGLLANTHVCMSGLVGIFGIYMIIDLVKSRKTSPPKNLVMQAVGLAVSGILVLAMVVPLLNSVSSNVNTSTHEYTLLSAIHSASKSILTISKRLISYSTSSARVIIFALFSSFALVCVYLLMRHFKRALVHLLVFTVFYVFSTAVIWYVIPSRAYVFIYTLVFILWIAKENEVQKPPLSSVADIFKNRFVKKALALLERFDNNAQKSISVLLCFVLLCSAPYGLYWLFYDYGCKYSCSEEISEFITENIPENSVIVMDSFFISEFCAYAPQYRYYSLELQDFIRYAPYTVPPDKGNISKIIEDLKNEENIYYIQRGIGKYALADPNKEKLYVCELEKSVPVSARHTEVAKVNLDFIKSRFEQ